MFDLTSLKSTRRSSRPRFVGLAALTLCIGGSMAWGSVFANTRTASAVWAPTSSERLVKLPMNYLKKTVDRDFSNSGLADAIYKNQDRVRLKIETLQDLRTSISRASDEAMRVELRHQYLAEKQAYLELVAEDQRYRRRRVEIQVKLYENLLRKLQQREGGVSKQKAALLVKQDAAANRFNTSVATIDTGLFRSSNLEESKYARDYARNADAIARLVEAIRKHPMTRMNKSVAGQMSKAEYIRQLITENEAKIAILDQEKQLWGYMAKVVSLDARALADALPGVFKNESGDLDGENKPARAIEFFIN